MPFVYVNLGTCNNGTSLKFLVETYLSFLIFPTVMQLKRIRAGFLFNWLKTLGASVTRIKCTSILGFLVLGYLRK